MRSDFAWYKKKEDNMLVLKSIFTERTFSSYIFKYKINGNVLLYPVNLFWNSPNVFIVSIFINTSVIIKDIPLPKAKFNIRYAKFNKNFINYKNPEFTINIKSSNPVELSTHFVVDQKNYGMKIIKE